MERTARALRERLGDEGMADLRLVVSDIGREWRQEVLSIAAERFERRLVEETSTLRVEMAKEFSAVRIEMNHLAHSTKSELLKWSFLFWISQMAGSVE